MLDKRPVVVSGDLGSGKSTVSEMLAGRLEYPRISMGDLHRQMAHERGMSALQLNLHAERDESIDDYIDQLQVKMAAAGDPLIVDSRLAWFFFPKAFKVHLVVDPTVGAERAISRPASGVESYSSLAEAVNRLQERSDSERARFLHKYKVDKGRLRNYDMVCDSTRARPEQICDEIIAALNGELGDEIAPPVPPLLDLDPARIHLSKGIGNLERPTDQKLLIQIKRAGNAALKPISVAYCDRHFYVTDGLERLNAAMQSGLTLIRAHLVAEGAEIVSNGRSACDYFKEEVVQ
jgi:CMP/dCMP kinase